MNRGWGSYQTYKQVNVETASQGKLVVMLFNGAIQRAEAAKRGLAANAVDSVHDNLVRAQDIIAELRTGLDLRAGEFAENIDRVYEYLGHLLVQANVKKSAEPIDEFVGHATGMRDAWEEAFRKAAQEQASDEPQNPNPHGSSVMNVRG